MSRAVGQDRVGSHARDIARCVECDCACFETCERCGRSYPTRDGIRDALGSLEGRNRIVADFYDGPGFARFQPLEDLFLFFQGPGVASGRRRVLRLLPDRPGLRVLEVGIGDAANRPLLPPSWEVFGVDIARSRLRAACRRFPDLSGRLAWAEAEALPFQAESFDVVFTIGGINHFRDRFEALREMARVARPGAMLLAADEIPNLHHFGLGRMFGLEILDDWSLRAAGLSREFLAMTKHARPPIEPLARRAWGRVRFTRIWNRLGYCLLGGKEG